MVWLTVSDTSAFLLHLEFTGWVLQCWKRESLFKKEKNPQNDVVPLREKGNMFVIF